MRSEAEFSKLRRLHTHSLYRGRWGQLYSRLVFLGVIALIFWLPLPFGSNRPWALAVFELAVCALTSLWLLGFISGTVRLPALGRWHFLILLLWLLWLGWLFLQWLPLPASWVAQWSPLTAELRSVSGAAETAMMSLSVYPEATFTHLHESLAYGLLFWLVIVACGARKRLRLLLWALLLSGLLQAAYGAIMTITGLEYGFLHAKEYYRGSATGTFVNRNHFAGYLELTLAAGFSLLLTSRAHDYVSGWRGQVLRALDVIMNPSLLVRVAIIVMFTGLVLSKSRMGNTAFLISLVACAGIYLALNWRRDWWRVLLLLVGFVLIDLWWVAGWFGGEALIERFESTRVETELRAQMLPALLEMIWLWPFTGAGMGSFHVLFPHFQGVGVTGFSLHAHNDYAQFLIELGFPGAFLILSIAGLSLLRALLLIVRRREHTVRGVGLAVLLAVGAMAVHSLTDFNLQIPANAATLVLMLAMPWCCGTHSSRQRRSAAPVAGQQLQEKDM